MRIAVDLRPLLEAYENGVAVTLKNFLAEFKKNPEIQLDLFYMSHKRSPEISKLFPEARHIKASNLFFAFKSIFGAKKLPDNFFKQRPDIIWLPDRRPFYKSQIPSVITIHDCVPEFYSKTQSFKARLWHFFFSLKYFKTIVDGILLPSYSSSSNFIKNTPKLVSYAGVSLAEAEGVQPKNAFDSEFNFKQDFFLCISPADPRKRLNWIFETSQKFPEIYFLIVGIKPNDKRFGKMKIPSYKNLVFLSMVSEEEKLWLYRNAKGLLALSMCEGFDLPVLEAASVGLPVIMSDLPVHRELYSQNSTFVSDKEALVSEMENLIAGKGKTAEPLASYTWERAAARALLFFHRVIIHKNRK